MRDTAAGATQGEAGAQHTGVADALDDGQRILDRISIAGTSDLQANLVHSLVEKLAVLAALDSGKVAADHLDAVALERTGLRQVDGSVKAGLTAQRGQQGVRVLALDDALDKLRGDGFDIGAVRQTGVGHDGGGVGVDEDDLVALLFEHLACLGAGVVELARLADDDGAGADDQDALDVGTFRHGRPPRRSSNQRGGRQRYRYSGNPDRHP